MIIVAASDEDFAALQRGDAFVREGLVQPPGGTDEPDVVARVRRLAASLHHSGYAGGHWMMVAGGEVVGLCGFKAPPSGDGDIELGYGVAASRRRQGYATAAVAAVIEAARHDPSLRAIVALTAVDNIASQRVLAKNGFAPTGTCDDADDGVVLRWRKSLA